MDSKSLSLGDNVRMASGRVARVVALCHPHGELLAKYQDDNTTSSWISTEQVVEKVVEPPKEEEAAA